MSLLAAANYQLPQRSMWTPSNDSKTARRDFLDMYTLPMAGHFHMTLGGVNTFESPHSPLGALRKGVRIRGPAQLTLDDATERARELIRDLGVPLEEVFMDLPPEV